MIGVGNLKFLPRRLGSDFVEFKAVGNLGIIREITALDGSGTVLGTETIQRHPFHSKECGFYLNLEQPGEIRAWRISYYRKLTWVDRPFEFAPAGLTAADEAEGRAH
ncbi:MAG: hypothetical protein K9N23_11845 [Akkermansiaceae bacterium]|nr:hypothetical protein [Akkermansiaceae bacterium]